MPFRKVDTNKYVSPSGRTFTRKQVELYYATDGFKNMKKKAGKKAEKQKNMNRIHHDEPILLHFD